MAFIYKIENIINHKTYIGSTIRAKHIRKYEHLSSLRQGIHPNIYLQRSFNKYGESNLKFSIVEELIFPINYSAEYINEYLINREFYYIELFKSDFNIKKSIERGKTGYKHSEETKLKIKNSNKKPHGKQTRETIEKRVAAVKLRKLNNIPRKAWSEESKQKASKSALGKKHSEESRKKIGEATRKRYLLLKNPTQE